MKELPSNKLRLGISILFIVAIISLSLLAKPVTATPPSGLTSELIASGALSEVVRAKFKGGDDGFSDGTDVKHISVVKYTLDPGGTFGWHQHGGPVWAVVKSGTLTIYEGDDASCTPQIFSAGSVFLDPGNRVHIGVNETMEPVEIFTTFMLPEGGLTRIDAADPGLCN